MEKFNRIFPVLVTVLMAITLLQNCSRSRQLARIEKNTELILSNIDTTGITRQEMERMLKSNMYESLVLEEDIDKGNISISDIKRKKIENE